MVDGVLLRSLPYKDPSQLVVLGTVYENTDRFRGMTSTSAPNFQDWHERTTSFESMGAVMNWQSFALYGGREPERVRVADVSSEPFSILGIGPAFGRNFGGDESILGRTITDAEKTFTVVGIMPADLKRRCHSRMAQNRDRLASQLVFLGCEGLKIADAPESALRVDPAPSLRR